MNPAVLALVLSLAAAPIADEAAVRASLPRTDGVITVHELAAPVEITRDAQGIPVIHGESLEDVIRAQGFVHGQDRFFQIDLMRRAAGGRLAALVGPGVLERDVRARRLGFGRVAEATVSRLDPLERTLVQTYAEGVNAGMRSLVAPPPEYFRLDVEPEPFSASDVLLVLLAMTDELNFNARIERRVGVMRVALPNELVQFLLPDATRFDAPLRPGAVPPAPAAVPGPGVVDLRRMSPTSWRDPLVEVEPSAIGSNNWAVAGTRTADGRAIVANDPHLMLSVPPIWYRVELAWSGGRAAGLSLPGLPGVLIGSTGEIAWGFTNTGMDFQDLVRVERHPDDPGRYRAPDGWEAFEVEEVVINVRGPGPHRVTVERTRWGPVMTNEGDAPLALRWTALEPDLINFALLRLPGAGDVDEAVAVLRAWRGPGQNALIADRTGRIAWVVTGYLPRRVGFDGRGPVSWANAGVGWDGPLDESLRPVVIDPPGGVLFTANNRTVDLGWARTLGNGWELGVRARRIEALLGTRRDLTERDLLAIQLDTRVEVFDFYADLLREVAALNDRDERRRAARAAVEAWDGTADDDQPGLWILEAWRRRVHRDVLEPLVAPCRALDGEFRYGFPGSEEPVRRILETRPDHLLPPGHDDWPSMLRAGLDAVLARVEAERVMRSWGDVNRARIVHPLAMASPDLGPLLNMPNDPLSGHPFAVRVATPSFGASARMVVSPGHEDDGVLHAPVGQSGHFLSPHYRDGHADWLAGRPTRFRAGATAGRLVLEPGAR